MAAFKENLVIEQGATYERTWKWTTGTGKNKAAVDLTGCTARMHIRETVESTNVLHELSTANGEIILGGVDGTVKVLLAYETTRDFIFVDGVYDIEIEQAPLHRTRRILQGKVKISQNVTRDPIDPV